MRHTRKLLLLVVTALSAMAVAAPSTYGSIAVETEPDPAHCDANITETSHVASGGCLVHMVGTESMVLTAHVFGVETTVASCTSEFTARIGEAGDGLIHDQVLSDVTANSCPVEPCKEGGTGSTETWPLQIRSDGTTDEALVMICVQAKGSGTKGTPCTFRMPVATIGHGFTFDAEPEVTCDGSSPPLELRGGWADENAGEGAHTNVEFVTGGEPPTLYPVDKDNIVNASKTAVGNTVKANFQNNTGGQITTNHKKPYFKTASGGTFKVETYCETVAKATTIPKGGLCEVFIKKVSKLPNIGVLVVPYRDANGKDKESCTTTIVNEV